MIKAFTIREGSNKLETASWRRSLISLLLYRVVYFKSHHCNSLYGASGRYTRVLSWCYLTNMEHFNTHHWNNESEQTSQNVWCNVNSIKDYKNNHSVIRQYLEKNSHKCIKTILKVSQIKIFNQKLQKNFCFFANIQHLICGKKGYINFWGKTPPFPKNGQMCLQKSFSLFSKSCFLWKFCRIKIYSTFQNIALLTHFLRPRFFDILLCIVEKLSKHKLFTSRAVMHCCTASFMWEVCCH